MSAHEQSYLSPEQSEQLERYRYAKIVMDYFLRAPGWEDVELPKLSEVEE